MFKMNVVKKVLLVLLLTMVPNSLCYFLPVTGPIPGHLFLSPL